jgi:DNA repair and recombination protein RAD52
MCAHAQVEEVNGKFRCGCSAIVRVVLKDGSFREDLGYGNAEGEPTLVRALERAKKSAVSDGIKRFA